MEGEQGAGEFGRLPCRSDGAGDFPIRVCAIGEQRKERGAGKKEKGDGSAVEWDQRGSERKGRERRACEQRPKRSGAG